MIKKITMYIIGIGFALFIATPILSLIQPSSTASAAACAENRLLGIPPWYRGLTVESNGQCNILGPTDMPGSTTQAQFTNYITRLALNVIEMAVVITAYIATFFILYGGFMFITGGTNSSSIEKARHSILNAIIGLAIALGAIAIINLIFGVIA